MTEHEERYVHFATCIERLQSAWATLNAIKAEMNSHLVAAAFRFALVEYATPYTPSEDTIKKRHRLDSSCVPAEWLQLHERVLLARNKIHAHADLTVLEAKIYLNEVQGQRYVSIVSNVVQGTEEFSNLESVLRMIEGTLENMFSIRAGLESKL
jgi:hypothetical protein